MALQINTGLTTNDGGSVSSGAYVVFETYFPINATSYNINMRIYRNQEAFDNNLKPIRGIQEIPNLYFEKDITGDLSTFGLDDVNNEVIAHLESLVGDGNISVV